MGNGNGNGNGSEDGDGDGDEDFAATQTPVALMPTTPEIHVRARTVSSCRRRCRRRTISCTGVLLPQRSGPLDNLSRVS